MANIWVCYGTIAKHQWTNLHIAVFASKPGYIVKTYQKKHEIIFNERNFMITPTILQQKLIEWYHMNMYHAGVYRTLETIRRNFTWTSVREVVRTHIELCDTCQRFKHHTHKYGELPEKLAEAKP